MHLSFLVPFVVAALAGGVFWYQSTEGICPAPLGYRLGQLDGQFNITPEQVIEHIAKAEGVWEKALGRELFYHAETAALTVNFVFDERQSRADFEAMERGTLDVQREENEKLFAQIEVLQREYESLSSEYEKDVAAYESKLKTYNEKVNTYNDQGAVSAELFAQLEDERRGLDSQLQKLTKTSATLQTLATDVRALSTRGNELVEQYNLEVTNYNKKFGFSGEFTQGEYQDKGITIYKFSDEFELQAVLVHELGHALGIGHVEGESSIMYYLLKDTNESPVLSTQDKEALIALCGAQESTEQRVRRSIRALLQTFNLS